jgi:hypothetical protein
VTKIKTTEYVGFGSGVGDETPRPRASLQEIPVSEPLHLAPKEKPSLGMLAQEELNFHQGIHVIHGHPEINRCFHQSSKRLNL